MLWGFYHCEAALELRSGKIATITPQKGPVFGHMDVHGLFTEYTCNRVSWILGCKLQNDATQTAGNVHMAAQAAMEGWLLIAIFFGMCVTP